MPEPLSKLERRILEYLIDYVRRNTYQPSVREIGRRFDIKSTKTVSEYLQSLADKGWVERDPSRSRGVRLLHVDLQPQTVTVPWYGAVAPEGPPLPADAVVDQLQIDARIAGGPGVFMIAMRGSSMEGAGIADGDRLVIEPASTAEDVNGCIVLARLAGRVLVARYTQSDAGVVLEPANPNFPAVLLDCDQDLVVLGRVNAVIRTLAGAPAPQKPAAAFAEK